MAKSKGGEPMNELTVFKNDLFRVRVIDRNGEPWFVAKDVCDTLEILNSRDTVGRLDADEKDVALTDTPGGTQWMTIVSESGLYSLILSSRKPEAKQFKRWITHEVIPQIRKTGSYSVPQSIEDLIILQAQSMKDIRSRLETQGNQIKTIKETLLNNDPTWREWVNDRLNYIAMNLGGGDAYREVKSESYRELERRGRCDLQIRLGNLKRRMVDDGDTSTAIKAKNKLDVIEADPKLKEIYTGILKEMVIKYVA
jgi:prophage antirepressor-like protein